MIALVVLDAVPPLAQPRAFGGDRVALFTAIGERGGKAYAMPLAIATFEGCGAATGKTGHQKRQLEPTVPIVSTRDICPVIALAICGQWQLRSTGLRRPSHGDSLATRAVGCWSGDSHENLLATE